MYVPDVYFVSFDESYRARSHSPLNVGLQQRKYCIQHYIINTEKYMSSLRDDLSKAAVP
jgi:hypothetical protein